MIFWDNMRRFYFSTDHRSKDMVTLSQDESRHICKVLRLQCGAKIELFDGSHIIYCAEIVELGNRVQARIISSEIIDHKQNSELWVGQGVIKTKKMELLLQKCTELGVNIFSPIISNRCQGNLVAQCRNKNDRWLKIIEEACKQCSRPHPMILQELQTFEEVTVGSSSDKNVLKLLFWEKESKRNLADFATDLSSFSTVKLLFGPEGGFVDSEIDAARLAGWQTVGLGKRILRAETAAIAAVAIVQHLLENI